MNQSELIAHVTPSDIRTQNMFHGLQLWFQAHGPISSYDAAHKAWGTIYLMVQQQAAMMAFVQAFWIMAIIFWAMLPLLLLLRNARDLHPHVKKPRPKQITEKVEEPELVEALQ